MVSFVHVANMDTYMSVVTDGTYMAGWVGCPSDSIESSLMSDKFSNWKGRHSMGKGKWNRVGEKVREWEKEREWEEEREREKKKGGRVCVCVCVCVFVRERERESVRLSVSLSVTPGDGEKIKTRE